MPEVTRENYYNIKLTKAEEIILFNLLECVQENLDDHISSEEKIFLGSLLKSLDGE